MDQLEEKGLAGYVYTQVSDIEEETNGILSYDRFVNKLDEGENGPGDGIATDDDQNNVS